MLAYRTTFPLVICILDILASTTSPTWIYFPPLLLSIRIYINIINHYSIYILCCTLSEDIFSFLIIITVCDCDRGLLNWEGLVVLIEQDKGCECIVNQESDVVGLDILNYSINFVSNSRLDVDCMVSHSVVNRWIVIHDAAFATF